MRKKGLTLIDPVELGTYFLISMAIAVFMFLILFKYTNEEINTNNIETYLLTKKITYSESCLAYNDGARVQQGTVDLRKLDNLRLRNCFSKESLGFTIKIKDLQGREIKSASTLSLGQQGTVEVCQISSGYECYTKRKMISYFDGTQTKTGIMNLGVVKVV